MLSYQYQSLQYNDSIRIVVLHPSSNISDPITCTIQHARLSDESLQFDALSYTWGDPTPQHAIYLHGGRRELLVRENCHNALRRLRLEQRDRLLWIDAICINQMDLLEQSQQVRNMKDVYDHASNIVVYVGEQDPDDHDLMEELEAADELISHGKKCDRPAPSVAIIQQLDKFFERPWFKRVWVLQEVCNKTSVTLMCGSTSVSVLAITDLTFGYDKLARVTRRLFPYALRLVNKRPDHSSIPQLKLWELLYWSRDYLATNPRDKVFALKSMVGPAQSDMDYLIDYTLSVEECYTQVAFFLLPVLGLQIFAAICHPHELDMPSWIPDWSQNLPLYDRAFIRVSDDLSRLGKESSFQLQKNGNRQELLVPGCQYARIIEISDVILFSSLEDTEQQVEGLYSSLQSSVHYVNAVSACNNSTLANAFGPRIMDVLSLMDGMSLANLLNFYGLLPQPSEEGSFIQFDSEGNDFFVSLQQRRIGLLDNGELVNVSGAAQCGDLICILRGTVLPCVLRSRGDGIWTLIGGDGHLSAIDLYDPDDYLAQHERIVEQFVIQ